MLLSPYTNSHSWNPVIKAEFEKPYLVKLRTSLNQQEGLGRAIFPQLSQTLRPFDLTPLWDVKCVLFGSQPYLPKILPGNAQPSPIANGLAYAVPQYVPYSCWPKQLKNLARCYKADLGRPFPASDLTEWAKSGCLLLNYLLTADFKGPHRGEGWERFTDYIVRSLLIYGRPLIWLLYGEEIQRNILPVLEEFRAEEKGHEIILHEHPASNMLASGFFWHKPFSRVDDFCRRLNYSPIKWY